MDIVIDFDGTVVTHDFPNVGTDIGAVPVLKELVANGHNLILFTMRSDIVEPYSKSPEIVTESGNYLTDAVNWFKDNEIPLYGVQRNPTQDTWTSSPKAYGQIIIDDAALGCPLLQDFKAIHTGGEIHSTLLSHLKHKQIKELVGRPYVDWLRIRQILIDFGCLAA